MRVSIPMTPPVESLNVAVAAALLVYEARRQREPHNHEGTKARGTMTDGMNPLATNAIDGFAPRAIVPSCCFVTASIATVAP